MTTRKTVLLGVAALLLGGLIWVAVPAVQTYQRRTKESVATKAIRGLFDNSISYYTTDFCRLNARDCPRQLPGSVALTPDAPLCKDGEPFTGPFPASTWDHPTWRALDFAPEGPQYFRYAYISSRVGTEARFTIRAVGDLDCDGVVTTFERGGPPRDDGYRVSQEGLFRDDER